jgi:putative transposase
MRIQMLEPNHLQLSIRQQAAILNICRSTIYYAPLLSKDSEVANLIREIYLSSDCRYGYRKVTAALDHQGHTINHKKVLRLMQDMGIQGLYPRKFKNTSLKTSNNIYPYLLEGLEITRPNQVWATDITYIALQNRFMYFIAIIDIYSRYIVAHELSANLEASFCIETLKMALTVAIPIIFNTDQGTQFTSAGFIGVLQQHGIQISMDHKGRCFDNIFAERLWRTVKQEAVYYYRPETVKDLEKCLNNFVKWYNHQRLHQSLRYQTPASVYFTGFTRPGGYDGKVCDFPTYPQVQPQLINLMR